ncbi:MULTISPECIES: 5'-deoxynucleotidase [Lachnospira]|uniref:5'-deoxynucleotidase n=1 Tax=Lachnospira pectinoschiza TaxID=28052 RepID=A0A1G9W2P9_9FIRM|nr:MULTISPECIES: 5'-deoxynucleotidase [Lachnospira]MBQ2473418.1 5'-deoxynucleotidase [Lachnospira sp.]SDM78808.1 5'-deoxynucleotidase [Lachnospira pectinoschiza]
MKSNHFYAMLSRMKYINRWGLMRNTREENLSEHSLEVAFIAHALGVINNEIFGGTINAERLAILAMYHDVTEIITGDMPTPVKYYSPVIRNAYKEVEHVAKDEILTGLPLNLRKVYEPLLLETSKEEELWAYVKAADKISAYIKCIEEINTGNLDFSKAKESTYQAILKLDLKEANYFLEEYIPAYSLTLDESKNEEEDNN